MGKSTFFRTSKSVGQSKATGVLGLATHASEERQHGPASDPDDEPRRRRTAPAGIDDLDALLAGVSARTQDRPTPSGWTYGFCSLDSDPQWFGPFGDLVRIWQLRRAEAGGLPARTAFAFEDFAGWMGRIFIAKIETDPFDLRFTLWGTTLSDWWGVDYTGQTLGAQSLDPETWAVERRYFEAMVRTPFIGLAGGSLTQHGREFVKVLGLDLPLSDGPGRGLGQVLSAHLRIASTEDFDTVLPDCPRQVFGDGA